MVTVHDKDGDSCSLKKGLQLMRESLQRQILMFIESVVNIKLKNPFEKPLQHFPCLCSLILSSLWTERDTSSSCSYGGPDYHKKTSSKRYEGNEKVLTHFLDLSQHLSLPLFFPPSSISCFIASLFFAMSFSCFA